MLNKIKQLFRKKLPYHSLTADLTNFKLIIGVALKLGITYQEMAAIILEDSGKGVEMMKNISKAVAEEMFKNSSSPERLKEALNFRENLNKEIKNG